MEAWYTKYLVDVPEGTSGRWKVEKFEVPSFSLENLRLARDGRGAYPGSYTKLTRGGTIVMSDTPAEISDHLDPIRRATGNVLINGLGLGMVLRAVLAKEKVARVDVVEASEDVIALVGGTYSSDPRVTIHHADAFGFKLPCGVRWDVVWHDIWDNICADNLPEMHRLHRKYGRHCNWQGSWARALCERDR